ncbi:MAG: hypothetical protein BGO55_13260 [Sphingobacteriales bacterium 50-39]|mgnify:CR=1 FL=1|nr:hypothetical protein [Sphingobacteriales bacterium]OJW57267.1 MAG: hypothetical protein BGO55_13260 [Sphingobacteriales bacterium 50-39]
MNQQNFHCSIVVPATAREAFEKISRVWDWWAVNFKGDGKGHWADLTGMPNYRSFTVHFARTTWSRMEIVEIVPDQFVLWKVVDCHLPIFKDPYLWKNHFIAWDISAEGAATRITMTHIGLIPGIECYGDCSKGWSFYVEESLYKLLTVNRGLPGSGIFAEVAVGDRKYEGLLFSRAEAFSASAQGSIIIDVRKNRGEKVLSAWSVNILNSIEPMQLKGDYYMILENQPVSGDIPPVEDLEKIIE